MGPWSKQEAIVWARAHGDEDDIDDDDLEAAFLALYERRADDEDRLVGLWSLIWADPDVARAAYEGERTDPIPTRVGETWPGRRSREQIPGLPA